MKLLLYVSGCSKRRNCVQNMGSVLPQKARIYQLGCFCRRYRYGSVEPFSSRDSDLKYLKQLLFDQGFAHLKQVTESNYRKRFVPAAKASSRPPIVPSPTTTAVSEVVPPPAPTTVSQGVQSVASVTSQGVQSVRSVTSEAWVQVEPVTVSVASGMEQVPEQYPPLTMDRQTDYEAEGYQVAVIQVGTRYQSHIESQYLCFIVLMSLQCVDKACGACVGLQENILCGEGLCGGCIISIF